MTEKPFLYDKAYTNLESNYMFNEDLVNILPKIISKKGIINVGGDTQSVFNFAKKYNNKIVPIKLTKKNKLPLNQTMSLKKLKAIINKKKN